MKRTYAKTVSRFMPYVPSETNRAHARRRMTAAVRRCDAIKAKAAWRAMVLVEMRTYKLTQEKGRE
jgi:hypothetical protein